jgi:hypothetical protein
MKGKRLKLASIGFIVVMLTSPALAAGSLRITRVSARSEAPGLTYSYAYPRLAGIQNNLTQQKLNVRFREMALTAKMTAELEAKTVPGAEGGYGFEVMRNEGGILSIMLSESLTRGVHTATTVGGVTVDTVSGSTYKLKDLFFENADYVSLISDKIEKQISIRGLDKKMVHAFKHIRKSEDYYLTKDDLVIIMGHEYFPEDLAVQKFTITLKSLEGSLKPELRLST